VSPPVPPSELDRIRRERGLTIQQLARDAGCSTRTIQRAAKRRPGWPMSAFIAGALDADPREVWPTTAPRSESLAQRARRLREAHGWSVTELARQLYLHRRTVGNLELDLPTKPWVRRRVCEALGDPLPPRVVDYDAPARDGGLVSPEVLTAVADAADPKLPRRQRGLRRRPLEALVFALMESRSYTSTRRAVRAYKAYVEAFGKDLPNWEPVQLHRERSWDTSPCTATAASLTPSSRPPARPSSPRPPSSACRSTPPPTISPRSSPRAPTPPTAHACTPRSTRSPTPTATCSGRPTTAVRCDRCVQRCGPRPRSTIRFMATPTPKDLRAANVAHVLARAVREGDVEAVDALRILRHELRRRNTNSTPRIATRSVGAQSSIDKYSPDTPPKNGSNDALHADHVYPFTAELLHAVDTVDGWLPELERLRTIVCVTAAENYTLQKIEGQGTTGPEKYALAGIEFTAPPGW
jgi:transcriptional regulator with XRE-family HTH domain